MNKKQQKEIDNVKNLLNDDSEKSNGIQNSLDKSMIHDDNIDPYLMFAQLEQSRIDMVTKFLSERVNQKTEIKNQSERLVLAVIEVLANNPFISSSRRGELSKGIKNIKDYKIKPLEEFIKRYYELGIPMGRKGRKEEVEVFKSLLGRDTEYEEKDNKSKLLR